MKPNRREFTLMGAGSVVSALSAPSVLSALSIDAAAAPSTDATETPWYRRIKRIGQTNFNEKDPQYGNVEKWADYWASAKVGAVAPLRLWPGSVLSNRGSLLSSQLLSQRSRPIWRVR